MAAAVLAEQGRQGLAGAYFDKDGLAVRQFGFNGTAELHAGANLLCPVLRVCGLLRLQQLTRHARVKRNLRRLQVCRTQRVCHTGQGCVHAGTVKGVGHLEFGGPDVLRFQLGCKRIDGVKIARDDSERWRILCGDLDPCGHGRLDDIGAGSHGQHGARALFKHGLTTCHDSGDGRFKAHHAGPACSGVFANAVPDHGLRLNAQAVQPSCQGIGHAKQRRLGISGLRQQGADIGVLGVFVGQPR